MHPVADVGLELGRRLLAAGRERGGRGLECAGCGREPDGVHGSERRGTHKRQPRPRPRPPSIFYLTPSAMR